MRKKEDFLKSIETIYKLFEFEIKDILNFYDKNKFIKEKEEILNKNIFEKWEYKEINWYKFVNTYWWIPIEPVFINNKIYMLSDEFYLINRVNYSNVVWLLWIFEKHIPRLIYEIISYDEKIIKNSKNNINIKLKPKDIYFLTKELKKDIRLNRMLILDLASEIVDYMIRSKKKFFKEISIFLKINEIRDDESFNNFIIIRNIICHLNGKTDYGFKSNITDRKIEWYTLYLRSEDIIKTTTYLLQNIETLNKQIIEKYR